MRLEDVFARFLDQVIEYLPSLAGGILLAIIGWAVAWFVKRVVIQVCTMLRLGRLLGRFRWAEGLTKADVRASLYGVLGNVAAVVVFLVFLDAAFTAMRLTVVSAVLEGTVFLFPRIVAALAIFGLGWLVSLWASLAVRRSLRREAVPRATLVAAFARAMVLLLFAAMAIAELNIAREVVIIGFTIIYVTLGALTVIVTLAVARSGLPRLLGISGESHLPTRGDHGHS
jgi:Mechanosensitive ion channel, conserved TM helix